MDGGHLVYLLWFHKTKSNTKFCFYCNVRLVLVLNDLFLLEIAKYQYRIIILEISHYHLEI